MKKIIQIITIGIFVSNVCWGQTWYFGDKAGIKFTKTGSSYTVAGISGSQLSTGEGCTAIQDNNGDLLLYSDGKTLWNKTGVVVDNGFRGHASATQSAVMVPVPSSNCGKYFLFTIPPYRSGNASNGNDQDSGFCYSVIEKDNTSATGWKVILKNKSLINPFGTGGAVQNNVTEKLTAVADGKGGYWVIVHGMYDNSYYTQPATPAGNDGGKMFYSYYISPTNTGIINNTLVLNNQGRRVDSKVNSLEITITQGNGYMGAAQGQMKISRDGSIIALVTSLNKRLALFNFDNNTGVVTDFGGSPFVLNFNKTYGGVSTGCLDAQGGCLYGIEFSPNSNYLYVSEIELSGDDTANHVYQFNLQASTPLTPAAFYSSKRILDYNLSPNTYHYAYGAMQIGYDDNIYVANVFDKPTTGNSTRDNAISVITNPNSANAIFNYRAITLTPGTTSYLGLPTILQNEKFCGDPCSKCHNVQFSYGGLKKIKKDTTIVLYCNVRSLDFNSNIGCAAPNIVSVIGCTVTDENGTTQSWASAFTNTNGNGTLNIPYAATPPVTYYVDYYFGTVNSPGVPGPRYDTCDHIRLTIIDSCIDIPCVCPPKPIITLKQQFRPGTVKQLNCGASEQIECNKLYTLDVDPACQPAGCSDKRYEISVRANGGLTQTFINQAVNIQPLATDKEFTITIKTYCGGKLCTTCTITLTVKCKCPPPPCCKTPVGTEFNAAVSTIREVSGTSFANLSFALNGNGKQYTQVRASVISFGIHADDKKCLDCYNNSRQWASISGGNLTGVQGFSRVFSGDNNGVNTNTREVTYTSSTPQIINTAQLTLNLMLPPMQTLSCCNVYATAYIKFTYRDNQCNECEKIIGIKIPLNGQQGKQPELINTPANIRAAGPAK